MANRWQGGKLIFRSSVAFSSTVISLYLQGIGSRTLPLLPTSWKSNSSMLKCLQ